MPTAYNSNLPQVVQELQAAVESLTPAVNAHSGDLAAVHAQLNQIGERLQHIEQHFHDNGGGPGFNIKF
jgi:outer membrane murein-binding lipoprotein Lpp